MGHKKNLKTLFRFGNVINKKIYSKEHFESLHNSSEYPMCFQVNRRNEQIESIIKIKRLDNWCVRRSMQCYVIFQATHFNDN